jgi:hypothetical protein
VGAALPVLQHLKLIGLVKRKLPFIRLNFDGLIFTIVDELLTSCLNINATTFILLCPNLNVATSYNTHLNL